MKLLMRDKTEKDWKLVETAAYGKEGELQSLLVESPGLISISELRESADPLVVAVPEFPLPVGYIDLLAFSADGDIAVIECKLASSPEAKRKVIGQVLEYGANLWQTTYEDVDQSVLLRTGKSLAELVGSSNQDPEWDEETFRNNVAASLTNGDFILIIVVDEINDDLSRIVRYVNASSSQGFDLAALEMRRFHSDKIEMLIPRFYGPAHTTSSSGIRKPTQQWNETSFFAELKRREGDEAVLVAGQLLDWSEKNVVTWWGKGTRSGAFVPYFRHKDKEHQLFAVWTYGSLEIYFYWYTFKPPFNSEEMRILLLNKLNQIEGVKIPQDAIARRPSIKLNDLAEGDRVNQFLAVFDWMVAEIKKG